MDEKLSKLILDYCLQWIGVPYIWAGVGYGGTDCSGFVLQVLQARGVVPNKYDATSHDLYLKTKAGGMLKPKAHALAFYGKGGISTHVAYCLNSTHVIECAGGGSECTSREIAEKKGAFVRIRPIMYRRDFMTVHEVADDAFQV